MRKLIQFLLITHKYRLSISVRYINCNGSVKERLLDINESINKTE